MRPIGTLASTFVTKCAPAFFVVIHDTSTMAATAILSENLLLEEFSGIVKYNGAQFQVQQLLTSLRVAATIPDSLGSGLIRRTSTMSVLSEALKGTPFSAGAFSKYIWFTGKPISSVTLSVWGVDTANNNAEITAGACFGFYSIDSDTEWNESTGECALSLVDVTASNTKIVGGTASDETRKLLSFNTDYSPKVVPTVFGAIQRVKTIRGYPDINTTSSSTDADFTGTFPVAYNGTDTTLVLEQNSEDTTILRQLINSGNTQVRLRLDSNEVVSGVLSYDIVTNEVSLTSCVRNTFYYTGKAYSSIKSWDTQYRDGTDPIGYATNVDYFSRLLATYWNSNSFYVTDTASNFSGVLATQAEAIGYGYAKLNVSFPPFLGDTPMYAKLSNASTYNEATRTAALTIEQNTKQGAYATTFGLGGTPPVGHTASRLEHVAIASYTLQYIIEPGAQAPLPYVKDNLGYTYWFGFRNNTLQDPAIVPFDTVFLYYLDPIATAGGVGIAINSNWYIIEFGGTTSFAHYINNGYCSILTSKLYCEGDKGLMEVPAEFIVSKADSVAEYGYTNLCKIVLNKLPSAMGIGAINNNIYTDTTCPSLDYRQVLYTFMASSPAWASILSSSNLNPTSYAAPITTYGLGFICSGESYSEILDKVCFQLSMAFRWNGSGCVDIYDTIGGSLVANIWTGNIIDSGILLENTGKLRMGQVQTTAIDSDRDYIALFAEVSYGAWMDPFYKIPKDNTALAENETYFTYAFDCLQTEATMVWAIDRLSKIGAAGMATTIRKTVGIEGGLQDLAKYEPLDSLLVNYYPGYTDDDNLSPIVTRSGGSLEYAPSSRKFLLQGVVVVESVEYNLSIGDISVSIAARISQDKVDFRGGRIPKPPFKIVPIKKTDLVNTPGVTDSAVQSTGNSFGSRPIDWASPDKSIRQYAEVTNIGGVWRITSSCGAIATLALGSDNQPYVKVLNCSGVGYKLGVNGLEQIKPDGLGGETASPPYQVVDVQACVDGNTKTLRVLTLPDVV